MGNEISKAIFNTPQLRQTLKGILHTIEERNEITIIEGEIVVDHIHLVVSFPPHHSISSVTKALNGASAREWFK